MFYGYDNNEIFDFFPVAVQITWIYSKQRKNFSNWFCLDFLFKLNF